MSTGARSSSRRSLFLSLLSTQHVDGIDAAGNSVCVLAANGGWSDEPTGIYTAPHGGPCTLTGVWTCGGITCTITSTSPTAFTVAAHGKWAWTTALGQITSQGDVSMTFNATGSPGKLLHRNATVDRFCCGFAISDGSHWGR
jgi:hypothetical protein